jgi:hypothetical protein
MLSKIRHEWSARVAAPARSHRTSPERNCAGDDATVGGPSSDFAVISRRVLSVVNVFPVAPIVA